MMVRAGSAARLSQRNASQITGNKSGLTRKIRAIVTYRAISITTLFGVDKSSLCCGNVPRFYQIEEALIVQCERVTGSVYAYPKVYFKRIAKHRMKSLTAILPLQASFQKREKNAV